MSKHPSQDPNSLMDRYLLENVGVPVGCKNPARSKIGRHKSSGNWSQGAIGESLGDLLLLQEGLVQPSEKERGVLSHT
jgi:hypothetical protein